MAFYTFWQNNSGGVYHEDGAVEEVVIVEADTAADANVEACNIGVYFNGVEKDIDCECCGDRWSPVEEWDAYEVPSLAEQAITTFTDKRTNKVNVVIYRKDGSRIYGVRPSWRSVFND